MFLFDSISSCGRKLAPLLAILVLAVSGGALAYEGFTVGLLGGLPGGGSYVLNMHAIYPITETELGGTALQFSARADLGISLAFGSLPALGLAAVTSAVEDGIERYLGLGAGVSFLDASLGNPLWTLYGVAGFRAPLSRNLYGVLELQLTSNRLVTVPNLGLALEYTFGGR